MRKLILLLFCTGCSLNAGPHVTYHRIMQPDKMMYSCNMSDHWFSMDRTVAMCDTLEECNEKCAALK